MDGIILALLGFITLKQLIADNFDCPINKKNKIITFLIWLIWGKKSQNPPVLCQRNYIINRNLQNAYQNNNIIEELLSLCMRHIMFFSNGISHGRINFTESNYFINTLEASYNEHDLKIMTTAILKLIAKSDLNETPDFVLFLKSGNQILANNIFCGDPKTIYVCQIDNNNFYPLHTNRDANDLRIMYENINNLMDLEKQFRGRRNLTGIVIDCSISTGSGLKNCIKRFNEHIKNYNLSINPIKHAYVLFAHQSFNDKDVGFTLHRYFDMNEDIRKLIYDKREEAGYSWTSEVYKKLKELELIFNE